VSKQTKPTSGRRNSGQIIRDDPLAWLTEEPQMESSPPPPADSPEAAKAPAADAVAAATAEPDGGEGWGLFDAGATDGGAAQQAASPAPSAAADSGAQADEAGEGWGLFDAGAADGGAAQQAASPAPSAVADNDAPADEAGEGWGLFDAGAATEVAETEVAETAQDEQDADGSWGLFAGPQDAQRVELGSSLTFTDVATCHQQLLAAAERGSVSVDGGAVERVDAAGLQLLCALQRSERNNGRALHWVDASATLRGGAADLGLIADLGLTAAAGSAANSAASSTGRAA